MVGGHVEEIPGEDGPQYDGSTADPPSCPTNQRHKNKSRHRFGRPPIGHDPTTRAKLRYDAAPPTGDTDPPCLITRGGAEAAPDASPCGGAAIAVASQARER